MPSARTEVERVFRDVSGRVTATMIRMLGDFDLAEDVVQEAFAVALEKWDRGIPSNPVAWLMATARNKAIDRIRRERALADKQAQLARLAELEGLERDEVSEPHPGRPASADLHLLPPRAVHGRARRADAAHARRP